MKALTAAEMREVDRRTSEQDGVPGLQLMESAGRSVAEYIRAHLPAQAWRTAIVLCGKGNNGGDGLVTARYLKLEGAEPAVWLFCAPEALRGDAAANLTKWRQLGGKLRVITSAAEWEEAREELRSGAAVVDALLGTGLTGPVEGLLAGVIADVNRAVLAAMGRRPFAVVAVDIPSGLPSDGASAAGPVIRAQATVTFTAPKIGQLVSTDAGCCGRLEVRGIGSRPELVEEIGKSNVRWLEPGEFRGLPLRRQPDAHKGSYGHVLLVAGSRGKTGAAVLAGRGALRAGAGLTTVATPDVVQAIVAAGQPELMTEALASTETGSAALANLEYGRFAAMLAGKTVLAVGPGLSTHQETQQFIRTIVRESSLPVILDADGLNAFAGRAPELQRKSAFLAVTPHPREMARLIGKTGEEVQADRLGIALAAAKEWNAYVVLKGFHTVLATQDGRAFVNTTGNAGMAKGGSGDVLTGILAGLTAMLGATRWERALGLGIYLHGLAGDLAAEDVGEIPLLATDLTAALPRAMETLLAEMAASG